MSKKRIGKKDGFGESLSLEELASVTGGQGRPVIPQPAVKIVRGAPSVIHGKTAAMKALAKREKLNILNSLVPELRRLAKEEQVLTAEVSALLAKSGLKKT
jgi:hypothetical protein